MVFTQGDLMLHTRVFTIALVHHFFPLVRCLSKPRFQIHVDLGNDYPPIQLDFLNRGPAARVKKSKKRRENTLYLVVVRYLFLSFLKMVYIQHHKMTMYDLKAD